MKVPGRRERSAATGCHDSPATAEPRPDRQTRPPEATKGHRGRTHTLFRVTDQRLWTKTFVVGIVVNLFMATVFYLLMTTMAMYAVDRFAASETGAGLASSSFIIGAVVGRVLAGKFLDLVGRRRMLVASMAVFVLAGAAYIPIDGFAVLIGLRLVHGFAFGMGNTSLVASIQSVIPPWRRAEGNGYFGTATTLATAVGPLLGVWLSAQFGFALLFWVASACGFVAMVAASLFAVPERTLSAEEKVALRSFHPASFVDPAALKPGAVMGLAGMAYSAVLAYLAVYTTSVGLPGAAGAYFVFFAIGSLAARLFAGRIQDRFGDNVVLIPVFVVFFAGMAVVAEAQTHWAFWLAGVLTGLGFGCLLPSLQAILISHTPNARVGVATSTFFLMLDVGTGIGPVVLGVIAERGGYSPMFWTCSGLVVLSAILYFFVHGRHAGRRGTT